MSVPRLLLGLLTVGLVACASVPALPSAKIRFPLDGIRADGLSGPAGGLVSIDYEFCVPADPRVLEEVKRLDPSVKVSLVARGRIGRRDGQALCLGNTQQKDWRLVLERLAARPDIAEIRRCYFE
ncbi:MAG: hypothetical protein RLZ70_1633 [Verrucomicrobiota bacterium]